MSMGIAPRYHPIPHSHDLPKAAVDPKATSPLNLYLSLNGLSVAIFARAVGMPYASVEKWVSGSVTPSLAAAYEIERITKGCIPMESWLGCQVAKAYLAKWRYAQNQANRKSHLGPNPAEPNELEAGGFAQNYRKPHAEAAHRRQQLKAPIPPRMPLPKEPASDHRQIKSLEAQLAADERAQETAEDLE